MPPISLVYCLAIGECTLDWIVFAEEIDGLASGIIGLEMVHLLGGCREPERDCG